MFAERDRSAIGAPGRPHFQRLVRALDWKYCYHSRGESQLFHLAEDPGETANLIREPAARAARERLHADLLRWMEETGDPRMEQVREA